MNMKLRRNMSQERSKLRENRCQHSEFASAKLAGEKVGDHSKENTVRFIPSKLGYINYIYNNDGSNIKIKTLYFSFKRSLNSTTCLIVKNVKCAFP